MTFTADSIGDQQGRLVLITGANSGLGLETAKALSAHGADVILACRTEAKARDAMDEIRAAGARGALHFEALDLSDLVSVSECAKRVSGSYPRLDLLVNNAGVMVPPKGRTQDGFETQLGTNHLGHFALTGQLLPLLQRTEGARVVTVSSIMHRLGRIYFDDLHFDRLYVAWLAYGQSKLANLLFTFELARRLERAGSGLLSVAAHPGYAATNLQAHDLMSRALNPVAAQSAAMGALPSLYAAVSPDVVQGGYYGPQSLGGMRGHPGRASATRSARDEDVARRLWDVSEQLTKVVFPL
ncbi:MAG: SDR family oxidoreductase [Sandaracinaceae bacterium]|nr:SDR family oxidoreductase [Myxococcales bacterium]MCB9657658.1 SDR family oxidoreductase [Sandaracinaceae bacterium]